MARLLRHWLAISLSALVVVPVVVVVFVLQATLVPHLRTHIEEENRVLAAAISGEVENTLSRAATAIAYLGAELDAFGEGDSRVQVMLDTLTRADDTIAALYLLDPASRVLKVGLPAHEAVRRDEYVGLDFSARGFVAAARQSRRLAWSDSYLSARGRISVGIAIPYDRRLLVGELDLDRKSVV